MTELVMSARRCDQCLCSANRIVSGSRAAAIIRDCRETGTHFVCHKAQLAGSDEIVHCRGVHDILARDNGIGSTAYQLALRLGIPVREIEPDHIGER